MINKLKTYGNVKILIRPHEFNKYTKYIKLLNIALGFIIIGLYPIPLAIYLNKYIKIKKNIRW